MCGVGYVWVLTRPGISQDTAQWEDLFSRAGAGGSSSPVSIVGGSLLGWVNYLIYLVQINIFNAVSTS